MNNTNENSFGGAINAGSNDASIVDTTLAVVNVTSCLFHSNTAGNFTCSYNVQCVECICDQVLLNNVISYLIRCSCYGVLIMQCGEFKKATICLH
jgi:hypothetical protein